MVSLSNKTISERQTLWRKNCKSSMKMIFTTAFELCGEWGSELKIIDMYIISSKDPNQNKPHLNKNQFNNFLVLLKLTMIIWPLPRLVSTIYNNNNNNVNDNHSY